jgi:hypothetical protein
MSLIKRIPKDGGSRNDLPDEDQLDCHKRCRGFRDVYGRMAWDPIESSFATIRHRARQTKGNGSRLATLAMMFKLGVECEKTWRRLNGRELIHKLIEGVRFIDSVAEKAA